MKAYVQLRAKLGANLWEAHGVDEEASNSKVRYFLRNNAMCRGGGCAAKVLVLTRGRPVCADHMITTILMILAKPRGEVMRAGVTDEPVVVVKRPAVDLHGDMHGDMRRGENRAAARSKPVLGKKATVEAKGGAYRKADVHRHAARRGAEKAGTNPVEPLWGGGGNVGAAREPGEESHRPELPDTEVRWNS
jgi:hypothetical protein